MSNIKNSGLDQYGAERFQHQHFRVAGAEVVKPSVRVKLTAFGVIAVVVLVMSNDSAETDRRFSGNKSDSRTPTYTWTLSTSTVVLARRQHSYTTAVKDTTQRNCLFIYLLLSDYRSVCRSRHLEVRAKKGHTDTCFVDPVTLTLTNDVDT